MICTILETYCETGRQDTAYFQRVVGGVYAAESAARDIAGKKKVIPLQERHVSCGLIKQDL
jgi:hypothetical protein